MKRILLLGFVLLCSISLQSQINSQFQERTLVLKVKGEFRSNCSVTGISYPGLSQILDKLKTQSLEKMFPNEEAVRGESNRNGVPFTDISLIYKLKYNEPVSLNKAISVLMPLGIFQYVEPLAIQQPLGIPNDPNVSSQWHLAKIKAYEAWDITQGDTNIVIGIVDTGIEFTHPDLAANIKYNYADPINGNDDDNDGYIDNFRGWDLVGGDNDPSHDNGQYHGTWVSGFATEVVDNNTQGAGVGYNTRVMPIKVSNSGGAIVAGYEGIYYAANHGCAVINASWGDTAGYTQYGQDMVNYAVINKNVLVVAAAGNMNNTSLYYPASLDHVISVGGSDTINRKWNFSANPGLNQGSTYNEFIDLLAPSMRMFGITNGGGFSVLGGATSFAAPQVSAAVALAKKIYPSYTALQLGELIKNSVDIIDTIPFNATYAGKIGTGRLNVLRALTVTGFPGFRLENAVITDNNNNIYISGDTIRIKGLVTNYLSASNNASVNISSSSSYLSVVNGSLSLGAVATLGNVNVSANPLSMKINGVVPSNTYVIIVITFTDGAYKESQAFKILLNPSYINMDVNNVLLSVGNDARLAYMQMNQVSGAGLTYKSGGTNLWSMGLVVTDKTKNASYSDFGDFQTVQSVSVAQPGIEADKDIYVVSNDNGAGGTKLGVEVSQKTLGWNKSGLNDFIIQEYKIKNTTVAQLDSVYVGLYTDWDVVDYTQNIAAFDTTHKIGYAYDVTNTFAGTKSLTGKYNVSHYAFNNNGSNGSMNIYNAGFTDAIAHAAISNGDARNIAGVTDVSDLVGEGPFNIAPGDSVTVAFAIIMGNSLNSLIGSGDLADSIYTSIRSITVDTVINVVKCKGGSDGSVALSPIYGIAPYQYQWNDGANQTTSTASGLAAGSYTCAITDRVNNKTNIVVNVIEPNTLLTLSLTDSIAVNGNCNGSATISASGGEPNYTYLWNDNLNQTTTVANNLCAGQYTAIVTDSWGCKDSVHVIIEDITHVSDVSKMNVKVIPNPANQDAVIFIESKEFDLISAVVVDESGRQVQQTTFGALQKSAAYSLNVSDLSSGTYFIKVNNSAASSYFKLIVTH